MTGRAPPLPASRFRPHGIEVFGAVQKLISAPRRLRSNSMSAHQGDCCTCTTATRQACDNADVRQASVSCPSQSKACFSNFGAVYSKTFGVQPNAQPMLVMNRIEPTNSQPQQSLLAEGHR
eukprot:359344-Chlamydomonas_euryale.AAC.3